MLWQTLQQSVELGWSFYLPVILFVALCALGVPVWAAIGASAVAMMVMSDVLPLALLGESLFDGIDAFALTAIPLFILTGGVLVRTGLSRKFLNVAEALTNWTRGGFGSATVLVCGMFSAISGSDAAGAAAVGRMTIDRLVESGSTVRHVLHIRHTCRVPLPDRLVELGSTMAHEPRVHHTCCVTLPDRLVKSEAELREGGHALQRLAHGRQAVVALRGAH